MNPRILELAKRAGLPTGDAWVFSPAIEEFARLVADDCMEVFGTPDLQCCGESVGGYSTPPECCGSPVEVDRSYASATRIIRADYGIKE